MACAGTNSISEWLEQVKEWVRVSGGLHAIGGNEALMFTRDVIHVLEPGDSLGPWLQPGRFDDRRHMLHNRHQRALHHVALAEPPPW